MSKVRISGSIASASGVTLFLEDGQELNLRNENISTKLILDDIVAALAKNEVVEIDLADFSVERRIEKKSGGLIRFIKEVFSPLTGWRADSEIIGFIDKRHVEPAAPAEGTTRMVAIVGDKRIENVQHLERQMEHAAYGEGYKGFENFLKRVASVADKRKHSMDELLNFMRRGDLPIADDGSIVAYKVLTATFQTDNTFVDCHTRKVTQRLGSRVSMPESLVDDSRRTECSTGLHIARRAYLKFFFGDVITIVKVAPEDVIAVPENEPDKMRAAAYHIVAVLPARVHPVLRSDQPMTGDSEAAKILADVIAGNHIGVIENVKIGGPSGTNLTIEPVEGAAPAPAETLISGEAKALDDRPENVVDLRSLRKSVEKVEREKLKTPEKPAESVSAPEQSETPNERRNRVRRERRVAERTAKTEIKSAKVTQPKKPASTELSDKEKAVLQGVAAGKSLRTLEKELGMCRKTMRKIIDRN